MGSEYCLTGGHTKNSHFFNVHEALHFIGIEPSKEQDSNNYCKIKACDCKQFRI
jgi:hypothetical protein